MALVSRILAARGITRDDEIDAFLGPKLTHLHDPSLIPDMDRAVGRILAALDRREAITIYGDYDVDGITAAAILFHTLRHLRPDADVRTYVPHRMEEGYGLNVEAMRAIAAEGTRVVVSVDCGVSSHAPAAEARRLGLDLIITDHHNPPARVEDLPEAYAVVHPRRPDSAYPFADLCGAGVAYKLAWRLCTTHAGGHKVHPATRRLLLELLTYAALGAIADVVPLVGENRVITRHALERIQHVGLDEGTAPVFRGLRALISASGLDGDKVDSFDVGFKLAPRLNACGRMGHARDAVELFTTADDARAAQIAEHLTQQNTLRRGVERAIFDHAAQLAEAAGMHTDDRRAIVLAHADWHPGVVGIVCSRLVQRFGRPTILMRQHDGECHGSARSIDGFNLHAALERCSGHLSRFGGHDMAAGLALREESLGAFTEAFTSDANERIPAENLVPLLHVDCEASLDELTPEAVGQLERLGPFGRGNPPVRLLLRGVRLASTPRSMGAYAKHLALEVAGPAGSSRRLRVVAWDWGQRSKQLHAGANASMVVEPKLSTWNGVTTVEPVLADLALG
jgi:single-stranded-DNA-specific exonuclease